MTGRKGFTADVRADRRQRVAELTRMGMTADVIAEILDVTSRTVVRDRRELGISQPAQIPISAEDWATVERLLADGASLTEAARTIGRPAGGAVAHRFKGRGWTKQQVAEWAVFHARLHSEKRRDAFFVALRKERRQQGLPGVWESGQNG